MSDILDLVSWIEFLKYNYEVVLKIATKKSNVLSSLDNRFVLHVCTYVCVCMYVRTYMCMYVHSLYCIVSYECMYVSRSIPALLIFCSIYLQYTSMYVCM